MYTVTVTQSTRRHGRKQIECEHLADAVKALTDSVAGVLVKGAKVMWTVRCPSGRTVRGDITINTQDPHDQAITDHIDYVREVLIGESNSDSDASSDTDLVSDDREGRTMQ